jgi:predicted CXXCH cytochrome family protein
VAPLPKQCDRTDPLSITLRVTALLVVAVVVGLFFAFARPAGPPAQAQSTKTSVQQTVIGRDCQQCHRVIVESFALDTHGKSAKFLKDSRAAKCEVCHANSEKHAETSTKTTSKGDVVNPAKLGSAEANQSCLQCHSMDRSHFNWQGSKHDRSDMSCLSCHNVHHVKLLNRMWANLANTPEREAAEIINTKLPEKMLASFTVEETCLGCHTDKRKALFQRSTHLFRTENWVPTRKGQLLNSQPVGMKVTCTSCHDPHGGEGRKMLQASNTNQLCYQCHADKRGPMLWEHAPVRENCLTCHTPHGSNNVSLLTTRTHQLCQECHMHMLWRHQTVAGFDIFTFNKGCVNCHTQIHGSNHPAGKALAR